MAAHRLIHIHCRKGRHIKSGQPHIHNNRDFQRTGVILKFDSKLILMCFIADDLAPVFGIFVAGGHHNSNFLCPVLVNLQNLAVNLDCNFA